MKTYYYLASVKNATSRAVRLLTFAEKATDAFASAAIQLSNAGFLVESMQELCEAQFNAPNNAPLTYQVEIQKAA